jgi:hypothetical protein
VKDQRSEDQISKETKTKGAAKKDFYIHFTVYICVNILLVIVWWLTGARILPFGVPWFVFPLGGWGIGVLFHFLSVFVFGQKRV